MCNNYVVVCVDKVSTAGYTAAASQQSPTRSQQSSSWEVRHVTALPLSAAPQHLLWPPQSELAHSHLSIQSATFFAEGIGILQLVHNDLLSTGATDS
jgi:hypothetical protein